ncbi:pyridoxamine 5'-phosphate oxidase family protein [Bacillus marinisedimentorum]|uniref:pyridoxamine 5'-phosphate oxidase family protein n=1 Tax=Bacillus marinisedimentorum TaxID=1821260 RepID=UPI00087349F5|nr:pyridoxamine 5'-phosphate oxidase family protein [Bacillus marinisedimentorum]
MDKKELKEKVLGILDENKVGTLATIEENKPHTRYMTFLHEDLTLYTPTSKATYKADEIKDNPNVHILLGYKGGGWDDPYVEIQGKAEIKEDRGLKEKFWMDEMKRIFNSPEDEDYIILKIQPQTIRYMDGEGTPAVLEL